MSLVVNSLNLNCNSLSYFKINFMMMKLIIEILTLIVLSLIAIMLYGSIKDNQRVEKEIDTINKNVTYIAEQLEIDIIKIEEYDTKKNSN